MIRARTGDRGIASCRAGPAAVRASTGQRDTLEVTVKTQGEIEAAISEGMSRFEQEYMGRGPKDIRSHLIGDLLVVRLQRVLAAANSNWSSRCPPRKVGAFSRKSGRS